MKTCIALGSTLSLLLLTTTALAAKTNLKATLSGIGSGTGTAALTYDDVAETLCGTITYQDLTGTPTAGHVHHVTDEFSPKALKMKASPLVVSLKIPKAEGQRIIDEETFLDLHTSANPDGEINGDIFVDDAGVEQSCPATSTDAGTDASAPSGDDDDDDAQDPEDDDSSGTTSGGTKTRADGGAAAAPTETSDSGCSTTGSSGAGSGLAFMTVLGLVGLGMRARRRHRSSRRGSAS